MRIGVVEPRVAARLLKLIADGNKYLAGVTSLGAQDVRIIIREMFQDPRNYGKVCFPTAAKSTDLRPYTKGTLLREERSSRRTSRTTSRTRRSRTSIASSRPRTRRTRRSSRRPTSSTRSLSRRAEAAPLWQPGASRRRQSSPERCARAASVVPRSASRGGSCRSFVHRVNAEAVEPVKRSRLRPAFSA